MIQGGGAFISFITATYNATRRALLIREMQKFPSKKVLIPPAGNLFRIHTFIHMRGEGVSEKTVLEICRKHHADFIC